MGEIDEPKSAEPEPEPAGRPAETRTAAGRWPAEARPAEPESGPAEPEPGPAEPRPGWPAWRPAGRATRRPAGRPQPLGYRQVFVLICSPWRPRSSSGAFSV